MNHKPDTHQLRARGQLPGFSESICSSVYDGKHQARLSPGWAPIPGGPQASQATVTEHRLASTSLMTSFLRSRQVSSFTFVAMFFPLCLSLNLIVLLILKSIIQCSQVYWPYLFGSSFNLENHFQPLSRKLKNVHLCFTPISLLTWCIILSSSWHLFWGIVKGEKIQWLLPPKSGWPVLPGPLRTQAFLLSD